MRRSYYSTWLCPSFSTTTVTTIAIVWSDNNSTITTTTNYNHFRLLLKKKDLQFCRAKEQSRQWRRPWFVSSPQARSRRMLKHIFFIFSLRDPFVHVKCRLTQSNPALPHWPQVSSPLSQKFSTELNASLFLFQDAFFTFQSSLSPRQSSIQ